MVMNSERERSMKYHSFLSFVVSKDVFRFFVKCPKRGKKNEECSTRSIQSEIQIDNDKQDESKTLLQKRFNPLLLPSKDQR